MLKIRLQRTGRKHETTFRVVLTDSKNSTKSGKFLEVLGNYDPRKEGEVLNADRIKYWISKGAQTSGTVHNMLVSHKVIDAKKINVLPKKTPPAKEEVPAEAPAPEVTATPEVKAEEPKPEATEAPAEAKEEVAKEAPAEAPKKEEEAPQTA